MTTADGVALAELLPVLNPQPLQALLDMGAESGLVGELVGLLKADAPARLAALREALAAADTETAIGAVHQLKGGLGTLGLQRFAELVRQMEDQLREGRLSEARGLVETFPAAYEEALAALQSAFPEA